MLSEISRWPSGRATACAVLLLTALLAPSVAAGATVVDRDEFSTTVDVGGGKLKTSLSSEPLNYQTAAGSWKPIDTDLKAAADGELHAASVDGDVAIPDNLAQPIELEHDGHAASFRLLGAEGDVIADGSEASFAHAIPGVDVSYVARAYGVKETLELQSALAPRSFVYDLRGGAGWSASVESGDVVLRDGGGTERYRVSAPLAWDSAPDPAFTNTLNLSVSKVSDGRWRVTLRPDADWLSDPTRQFPVSIDPDFSWSNGTTHFHGAQDCYLSGYAQANYTFCAQTYLQTGWYNRPYRSIFKFDIASAIPSNATVSAAEFKTYQPPQTPHIAMGHKLQTITSDWDSTATWNNRKTGTPWATFGGGGDVSTAANLTSASTTVQAYNAWYSWNAPLDAVQGWVNGSLPNYGFMLSTTNAGNIGNAYAWASTEASTTSQFPADSTKWPTLDITWSQPAAVDGTAPSDPTELQLEPYDSEDSSAVFAFVPGADEVGPNSAPPVGGVTSSVRFRRGAAAYGTWQSVPMDHVLVPDVQVGDMLTFDVQSIDANGNASAVTSSTFTVAAPAVHGDDIAATGWYADTYGVTAAAADAWMETQGAGDLFRDALVADGTVSPHFGSLWFDNSTRLMHVQVTDNSGTTDQALQSLAKDWNLDDALVIDHVAYSEAALSAAVDSATSTLASLVTAQRVGIYPDAVEQKVRYEISSAASTAERAQVESVRSAAAVPSTADIVDPDVLQPTNASLCSDPHPLHDRPTLNYLSCGGPLRGGTAIWLRPGGLEGGPCTLGFTAQAPTLEPLMVTAGHCMPVSETFHVADQEFGSPRQTGHTGGELWYVPAGTTGYKREFNDQVPDGQSVNDAAAYYVDNPTFSDDMRPWTLVLERRDSDEEQATTYDPHYEIEQTATPAIGTVVCATGGRSHSTRCGKVFEKEPKYHRAWADFEMMEGDSGGPVYKKHNAYGVISILGQKIVPSSLGIKTKKRATAFVGTRSIEDRLDLEILTVSRAHGAMAYLRDCDSGWTYIEGAGCLLIL